MSKNKEVSQIYDIEKLGLDNQYYLVEYTDNTMEKVSTRFIKQYFLSSYVQFLENSCFA